MSDHDDAEDTTSTRPAATPGERSVIVGHNAGVVQTGDHTHARVFTGTVSLGSPQAVDVPPGGLLSLPKPAARVFLGRDDQLDELDRLVRAGAGVVAQALHGLGGVGKSELALQYATRNRARYRVVWWVIAEDPNRIETGLAQLAFRLHPDVQVIATQSEAATWAMAWLQSHDGWLLILDNAEHRHEIEPLLAQLTNGHTLITTRRDVGWEDITDGCVRLDVLEATAAVALLIRLSGQTDPETAGALAAELGCLPLALQQAGAYLRQVHAPMAEYLQRLHDYPSDVLAAVAAGDDARRAIARTWSVTTDRITEQEPLATQVLQILSCFAPDALPRYVLTPVAERAQLDKALGVLASYNMITLTNSTVDVHRLVQVITASQLHKVSVDVAGHDHTDPDEQIAPNDRERIIKTAFHLIMNGSVPLDTPGDVAAVDHADQRDRSLPNIAEDTFAKAIHLARKSVLSERSDDVAGGHPDQREGSAPSEWKDILRTAIRMMRASLPPGHPSDVAGWPRWAALSPHIAALASLCSDQIGGYNLASLLGETAIFDKAQGRYAQALAYDRRAIAATEATVRGDNPEVAIRLNNLADGLREQGRFAEAEALLRRSLAIIESWPEVTHAPKVTVLNNLALTLKELGRPTEAEALQRRVLAIVERTLGRNHPRVGLTLNNLALSLQGEGRFAEAEPLQRRALAITEAALGPKHPNVATALDNLADILRALGRAAEAEPLNRRSVAITETVLGGNHPSMSIQLSGLAVTLRHLGRVAEAEPLQRRALAIAEVAFGPDHPQVAFRLNQLAITLRHLGRAGEAEPLHRRALAITETALGGNHPDVAFTLDELAVTLRHLGRAGEAEPLHRRALAITETALGADHPDLAFSLHHLAVALRHLDRAAEAEPLHRRALAITEAASGPDHPDVAARLDELAVTLRHLGRAGEAEPLHRRALAITETALGGNHSDVAERLHHLAVTLRHLDRAAEAEPLHRRALAITETASERA
jgi:tetratricopeptide (TPR) repeat protein